jgi:hypothetical protein
MNIDWGYVAKRWIMGVAILVALFLVVVIIVRLTGSGSNGTPVEGGENQPDVIEGKPKQPSLNDATDQPQNNVGGLEEYRHFEAQN